METMDNIPDGSVVARATGILDTDVDGEAILLNLDRGYYYGLDAAVGTRIWEHIKSPLTVVELSERLLGEFCVDPERCRRETKLFIAELASEGLVTIARL